ncbi:MAG: hypothetical protein Q8779_02525 [Candidatus Phytoplasma stylosanthis]|nr:hypothetical protein [Candidatus Phytoplasma stylosanthis]MDV3174408.1 hypothetical protein [Candidatus Phytoplasma stylosanthis]
MKKEMQHQELVLKSEQNYQELKQIKTELEKMNKKEKREEKKGETSDGI